MVCCTFPPAAPARHALWLAEYRIVKAPEELVLELPSTSRPAGSEQAAVSTPAHAYVVAAMGYTPAMPHRGVPHCSSCLPPAGDAHADCCSTQQHSRSKGRGKFSRLLDSSTTVKDNVMVHIAPTVSTS